MKPIISVKEARKILGKDADDMTNLEIENVIETLDLLAKDSLQVSKEKLLMKRDARRMAELIYDIYQDKKNSGQSSSMSVD